MNDIAMEATADLSSDPRWLLTQRVAQSDLFRHSPRLRAFLLFIVERTLRNCTAELGEYEIGTRVFDRTADFNPAEDSIVRSTARLLRGKLKEYFAGEGARETLLIEIPKGGYVAEFVPRVPAATADLEPVAVPRGGHGRIVVYALSIACVALLALSAYLWRSRAGATQAHANPAPPPNLILAIFRGRVEVSLVYGDAPARLRADLGTPALILDDYVHQTEREPVGAIRLVTSYRDAAFGLRLSESAARQGQVLIAHHSRLMQARNFRAGNFILLGGVFSNPWSALFEPQLNFRLERDPSEQSHYGFRNVAPRPGEASFYWFAPEEGRNATRYARIALTPNLTGTGKVLMLAGQSAEGTEGAGDAALAHDFLAQVQTLLGDRPLDQVASLELLLEVHSMDGAPRETRILASRVR